MNAKTAVLIASLALLTVLCLAGSIYLIFFLLTQILVGIRHVNIPVFGIVIIFMIILFAVAFLCGGMWGWGIGRLMDGDVKKLARSSALAWGTTVMVCGVVLYFAQIPIAAFDRAYPVFDHYLFTLAFLPAVGLAAGLNTRRLTSKLGLDEWKNAVGRNAGLAAAIGFLTINLVLVFVFEWKVGGPYAGTRYSMIKIMHLCNAGAALFAGAAMGWTLQRAGSSHSAQEMDRRLNQAGEVSAHPQPVSSETQEQSQPGDKIDHRL